MAHLLVMPARRQQSFFSTMSLSLFASNAALAFLGGANLGGKVPAQPELAGKAAFKAAQFPGLGAPSEVRPGYASGLPGDIGFDPLGLANFDLTVASATDKKRSAALVLQDYRGTSSPFSEVLLPRACHLLRAGAAA